MKQLRIHPDHVELYCEQPRTSRNVSDHFGISLTYAQQILRALKQQERLHANPVRDASGHKLHTEFVATYTPPSHDPFNLTRRVNHGHHQHTASHT